MCGYIAIGIGVILLIVGIVFVALAATQVFPSGAVAGGGYTTAQQIVIGVSILAILFGIGLMIYGFVSRSK